MTTTTHNPNTMKPHAKTQTMVKNTHGRFRGLFMIQTHHSFEGKPNHSAIVVMGGSYAKARMIDDLRDLEALEPDAVHVNIYINREREQAISDELLDKGWNRSIMV